MAKADREPKSDCVLVAQRHDPEKAAPAHPVAGAVAFDFTVSRCKGTTHETYDNSFGFSSCDEFIHGFRTGSRWWRY
jgi:hypothetical protein